MNNIYLFDWGDTLMVDYPQYSGKMCDWPTVAAVPGAQHTLAFLAKNHKIYVATNAVASTASDIRKAFERVGLAQYISGYFCKANLGIGKGSPEFYLKIAAALAVNPKDLVMVGDTTDKDIIPAVAAGLTAIWFNPAQLPTAPDSAFTNITDLRQLCT